jgi:hypothetical protein
VKAADGEGWDGRVTRRGLLLGAAATGALVAAPSVLATACDPATDRSALAGRSGTTGPPPATSASTPGTTVAPADACAFRNSLSVSPFAEMMLEAGIVFTDGQRRARSVNGLQQLFVAHGATEVYARIATLAVTGVAAGGAEMGWARGLERAKLAADLGLPFNPELGLFARYGDSLNYQQPPDFSGYPDIKLPGPWFTLTIDQMADALRQYGELAARQILATGARVEHWDIGNEVDYGVAGVTIRPVRQGTMRYTPPDSVDPAIGKMSVAQLGGMAESDRIDWCNAHLWPHVGTLLAATRDGIRRADPTAKFSTHIAGLGGRATTGWTAFWDAMNAAGYLPDSFGTSFYPTGPPAPYPVDPIALVQQAATELHQKYGRQTMIAEAGYPSGPMSGAVSFNTQADGYPFNADGQAKFFHDVITAGVNAGWLSGVRPWSPDAAKGNWAPMSFFDLRGSAAIPKPVIDAATQADHNATNCAPS